MADITSSSTKRVAVVGELKFISFVTPSNAATGDTIDLNFDAANARGAEGRVILNTVLQNTTGTNVANCTWSNTTGIVTLPSITTGVHKLLVVLA